MPKKLLKHRILDGIALQAGDFIQTDQGNPSNVGTHKILVVGKWDGHWMGSFSVNKDTLNQILQHFNGLQVEIPVDYEHATIFADKAPASGWFKDMEIRTNDNDGQPELFAKIEWTPNAANQIRAGEYKYVSPVIVFNTIDRKSGRMTGASIPHMALTNVPFLHELPEVRLNSIKGAFFDTEKEDNPMNEEQYKALCKVLGLSENATVEEVTAACTSAIGNQGTLTAMFKQLSLEGEVKEDQAVGAIIALQNPADRVDAAQFRALQQSLAQRDANDAVAAAMGEGKVTGAGTEMHKWAMDYALKDLAGFKAWANAAAKVVPTDPVPRATNPTVTNPGNVETPNERNIEWMNSQGITLDEFNKLMNPQAGLAAK